MGEVGAERRRGRGHARRRVAARQRQAAARSGQRGGDGPAWASGRHAAMARPASGILPLAKAAAAEIKSNVDVCKNRG